MPRGSTKKIILAYLLVFFVVLAGAYTYEVLGGFLDVRYIATSSMEPSFPRGSLIIIAKDPYNFVIGDPIIYRYLQAPGKLLFHRAVDISGDSIYVKGDAVDTVETIRREQVYGVYLFGVPYIGLIGEVLIGDLFFTYLLILVATAILLFTLIHNIPS